jgi:hypothetical protein
VLCGHLRVTKANNNGGTLELGGPIVAFVLVVGGGFVLVPKPPSTFPLTVYVHSEADRNDLVLRNSGRVFVDLDGDRQSRSIGENGEAYFPAFPIVFADRRCRFGLTPRALSQLSPIKKRGLMALVFTYQFEEGAATFPVESKTRMETRLQMQI